MTYITHVDRILSTMISNNGGNFLNYIQLLIYFCVLFFFSGEGRLALKNH